MINRTEANRQASEVLRVKDGTNKALKKIEDAITEAINEGLYSAVVEFYPEENYNIESATTILKALEYGVIREETTQAWTEYNIIKIVIHW